MKERSASRPSLARALTTVGSGSGGPGVAASSVTFDPTADVDSMIGAGGGGGLASVLAGDTSYMGGGAAFDDQQPPDIFTSPPPPSLLAAAAAQEDRMRIAYQQVGQFINS